MTSGRLRLALLALLLFVVPLQARRSVDKLLDLAGRAGRVRSPFVLVAADSAVTKLQPEALRAGLAEDDRLASIEGEPARGAAVLSRRLATAAPGETLRVRVAAPGEPGGSGPAIAIPLVARERPPAGAGRWSYILVVSVAMPFLCLALGAWAVLARPRDPLAWLLLALMLSFSQLGNDVPYHWPAWLVYPGILWHNLTMETWPVWMMLFGIYFPERLPLDRRYGWAKWILLVPLSVLVTVDLIVDLGRAGHAAAVEPLRIALRAWTIPAVIVRMVAIASFFNFLGYKSGTATTPDARRRLTLLLFGTAASLAPLWAVVLIGLWRGAEPFSVLPGWVITPVVLMMLLFPVTLAYVIVVHRALDVRVVIRQGVQYALARRGVLVLQVLATAGVIATMIALATRPETRRVEAVTVLGAGVTLIFLMRRVAEKLSRWIDRRFFRDAYDAQRILGDLSEQVRTMVETAPLMRLVAEQISRSLHVPKVAVLLKAGSAYAPAHSLGYAGTPPACFPEQGATVAALTRSHDPLRTYLDDPKSWVNAAGGPPPEERASLQRLGTQLLLPLAVKEWLPGFLSLGAKQSEEPYSGSDLRLLRSVAAQAGLALENSRLTGEIATEVAHRERLNREVEIAREVQERLFPQTLPAVAGLDYAGACRPALGVGGDYYDFLALPGGALGVAIADVSGKGIGAALLMASLQASVRGQMLQGAGDLSQLTANVSRLVYDASPENRYATFFYAHYEPSTRRLSYVNAGHCPPIVLRRGASGPEPIRLKAGGTVVGLFTQAVYTEAVLELRPGDLIVAYTDGISEALNHQEEEFGEERLIEAALRCDGLPADRMILDLMTEADRFAAGAPQHDDMTLVVLRFSA